MQLPTGFGDEHLRPAPLGQPLGRHHQGIEPAAKTAARDFLRCEPLRAEYRGVHQVAPLVVRDDPDPQPLPSQARRQLAHRRRLARAEESPGSLGLDGRLDHRQRQREYRQRLKARVTDQSSLHASPCVNLTAPPASEPAEAPPPAVFSPGLEAEYPASWVVCQVCGRQGRWVNPFSEVQHDSR